MVLHLVRKNPGNNLNHLVLLTSYKSPLTDVVQDSYTKFYLKIHTKTFIRVFFDKVADQYFVISSKKGQNSREFCKSFVSLSKIEYIDLRLFIKKGSTMR